MSEKPMITAHGTIHITDEVMQGFYKYLEKKGLTLDDVLENESFTSEEPTTPPKLDLYKIKVDDGWLCIERSFYRHMKRSIEGKEFASLIEYLDFLERDYTGGFRIVQQESRATIFDSHMASLIYDISDLVVLKDYEHYYLVCNDDTKKETKVNKSDITIDEIVDTTNIDNNIFSNEVLYKFKTVDGWFQLDRTVYRKILEYFKNTEYPSIYNFFMETGIPPKQVSRIIKNEKHATIFNEQIAIDIYTFDECFVLSEYDSYKMIDQNGEENPYLDF